MRSKDPWYDVVTDSDVLMQGDLLQNCPTVEPYINKNTGELGANGRVFDVIVMSQSCELAEAQAESFMVCNYVLLSVFRHQLQEAHANANTVNGAASELGKGRRIGYHALNPCILSGHEMAEPLVVDFHNVFGVPLQILLDTARKAEGGRLRLLSPYREYLSQAFAQFFMKVALPVGYYSPIGKEQLPPEDVVVSLGASTART